MNKNKLKQLSNIWVTVDAVIFTVENNELKVLLVKRQIEPYKNRWSLPGGFINRKETSFTAAERILKQKANFSDGYMEQLYTFDLVKRDPRGRVVSIAYLALVPRDHAELHTDKPAFFSVKKLPVLAFDHKQIIQYAVKRLQAKLEYTNAAFSLLPRYFTFAQLQKTYEIILSRKLDKRNFRKKFMLLGLIKPTDKTSVTLPHRPARLYRFISLRPSELKKFF